MVAEAKVNSLPPEVLILKQEYSYSVKITPRIIKRDVQVFMTFTFEGNLPFEFSGSEEHYDLENEDALFEAESFVKAAQSAWINYRRSDRRRCFVHQCLTEKWNNLKGEKLTQKKLVFNKESDEIVDL